MMAEKSYYSIVRYAGYHFVA